MDDSLQKAVDMTAGLVLIPRDDSVIVWMGLVGFLRQRNYQPAAFRLDLNVNKPRAIAIAKELVASAVEKFGYVGLGTNQNGMSFQRLDLSGELVGVRGVISTKEIRVN